MSAMANLNIQGEEAAAPRICQVRSKYTLRQLEASAQKYVKILNIDLERLSKHTVRISRLTKAQDWNNLHQEQVNACRTIQQVTDNIKEIERVRNQVRVEDLRHFDSKIHSAKTTTLTKMDQIVSFIGIKSNLSLHAASLYTESCHTGDSDHSNRQLMEDRNKEFLPNSQTARMPKRSFSLIADGQTKVIYGVRRDLPHTHYGSLTDSVTESSVPSHNADLHVVPLNSNASVSKENLKENILELNALVHQFATEIEHEMEVFGDSEDNSEIFPVSIQQGTEHPAKTIAYKSALLPVMGAVVGGVVAGPIGLVAGVKIGGLLGAVGGAVGFAGGRLAKARQDKTSSEAGNQNLSDQNVTSKPDLQDDVQADFKGAPSMAGKNCNQATSTSQQAGSQILKEEIDVLRSVKNSVTNSFKNFFSFSDDK